MRVPRVAVCLRDNCLATSYTAAGTGTAWKTLPAMWAASLASAARACAAVISRRNALNSMAFVSSASPNGVRRKGLAACSRYSRAATECAPGAYNEVRTLESR